MKKFWRIMSDDFREEEFTLKEKVVYGLIVPLILVTLLAIAGTLVP